ncbi:Gfo/Idh/MocA family oxidoreductase [Microbacterium sufflavum]|uniref:Gfo/Idh/MocA family oxidoreductase n=1 Tax=Microbacterium sufflavum TaxID=2851649 RepID=A0ABY4IDB3_9MICO|nr:Gfo/Idh/MocA family oxidoreductase [Microbacterium sufflavum]MBN6191244.1 Gfo/Idh/MocA family oxidoreductase [Aneurinibacillus sp. BA2021]UPL10743.1 Gfo/Idh/MocA family oxidoreductase [Microbacterium sufflavum]
METKNVAIVGIENTHATEIVRHLNGEEAADLPVRVSALVAGEVERTRELAELGAITRIAPEVSELNGAVDALIVTSRDGALHRALAVPFLEAGTPVWVDKPLATTLDDADAILAAAERGGTTVTSFSTLRWLDDTAAIADAVAGVGALQSLTVSGPADADSPHGGLFFYGIHHADVAQHLLPGAAEGVEVERADGRVVARYRVGGVPVVLDFVRPEGDAAVPFHVTAVGTGGTVERDIEVGPDYVRPGVDAFVRMLLTGETPVPVAQLREPIAVLEQITRAL